MLSLGPSLYRRSTYHANDCLTFISVLNMTSQEENLFWAEDIKLREFIGKNKSTMKLGKTTDLWFSWKIFLNDMVAVQVKKSLTQKKILVDITYPTFASCLAGIWTIVPPPQLVSLIQVCLFIKFFGPARQMFLILILKFLRQHDMKQCHYRKGWSIFYLLDYCLNIS